MEVSSAATKILRTFPEEVQDFFQKLDRRCKKHKIALKLTSGRAQNFGNGRASGLFDAFNKRLSVALGGGWEHAMSVAIHEGEHLSQWLDTTSIWHNTTIDSNYNKFNEWLKGKDFKNPGTLCSAVIAIERDCERRAIAKIKQRYSHLLDVDLYTRRANAYLSSHRWMLKHRKWLKKTPYNRKITAHCSSKLWRSFECLPEPLEMALEKWL